MRKYLLVVLSALLVCGFYTQARAESSSHVSDGLHYYNQQVFVIMKNNSTTSDATANCVVVIDNTVATSGTIAMGDLFLPAVTNDDRYVVGVADETIATGALGRVCVRGPHLVHYATAGKLSTIGAWPLAGRLIGSSATPGQVRLWNSGVGTSGVVGLLLKEANQATDTNSAYWQWWAWINPRADY